METGMGAPFWDSLLMTVRVLLVVAMSYALVGLVFTVVTHVIDTVEVGGLSLKQAVRKRLIDDVTVLYRDAFNSFDGCPPVDRWLRSVGLTLLALFVICCVIWPFVPTEGRHGMS